MLLRLTPWRHTPRVRIVVRSQGDVLLIRGWFSNQAWSLPGGGIEKGETPVQAAVRELREETSLEVGVDAMHYVTTIRFQTTNTDFYIFVCEVASQDLSPLIPPHNKEIIARGWYEQSRLPLEVRPEYRQAVQLAIETKN